MAGSRRLVWRWSLIGWTRLADAIFPMAVAPVEVPTARDVRGAGIAARSHRKWLIQKPLQKRKLAATANSEPTAPLKRVLFTG
jgi:hypothetical protein